MQNFLLIVILFHLCAMQVFSQAISVNGTVTSADDKFGIPGATIIVKANAANGTVTDIDGNYKINCNAGDVLVFRYVGYTPQEFTITESKVLNVVMASEAIKIDEVVVTALGMKREKKALGYSVQEVSGTTLKETKELNIINSLSGKVAGVNITQGGGGVGGGGARIVIRGETSLAGNNEPLYVIDGVPGSANDVAADDVESLSVLKGPSASALYGSRAAAGVVLITTKSGKSKNEGFGIELNSNVSFQTPFILPDYQNEFGQGTGGTYEYFNGNNGVWPDGSISNDDYSINWGPKFDGQARHQFTGYEPWIAYPNNVKDFYRNGLIMNNNVSFAKAADIGNFRVSLSNIQQKGIIPNTDYGSSRIDINGNWLLNDKISIGSNLKYYEEKSYNNKAVDVRLIPRNIDIAALRNYWVPGLEGLQQLKWRFGSNNPYFELYENRNEWHQSRIIANINTNITFNKFFSFMGRVGLTRGDSNNNQRTAFSTVGTNNQYGSFGSDNWIGRELNSDFLFTYQANVTKDINLKASVGGNHMRKESSSIWGKVVQLLIPDIYNLGNYRVYPKTGNGISKKELNSIYAFANIAYKNFLYFDVTSRNDWSSTLPAENNSYFYPSFTLSALLNEMMALPKQISFWKLRGSWAKVGSDTEPYQLQNAYYWGTGSNGVASITPSSTKANSQLKPELTSAWEVGTDLRLFNNRLNIDFTYYNSNTVNQILKVEVSPTTGYEYILKNAGKINNSGYEIMLNTTALKSKNFSWDMTLNWSLDRSIVREYDPDSPDAFLSRSITKHLFVEDRTNERRGSLYGKGYKRAPNGEILFTKSGDTQRGEKKYLGNYNPDWMAGFTNELKYKNISLSILFDVRWGGVFYSETNYNLTMKGLSKATLLGGYDPQGNYQARNYILPDGMVEDNGSYRKLTKEDLISSGLSAGGLTGQQYWENMMDEEIPEAVIYDATYLKLRELKLAYNFPEKMLKNTFIKDAMISMVVRNLFVLSHVPNVDPETFSGSQQAGAIPGYDTGGIPSTRNIAFNLNIKF